jgi:hypothetical protein
LSNLSRIAQLLAPFDDHFDQKLTHPSSSEAMRSPRRTSRWSSLASNLKGKAFERFAMGKRIRRPSSSVLPISSKAALDRKIPAQVCSRIFDIAELGQESSSTDLREGVPITTVMFVWFRPNWSEQQFTESCLIRRYFLTQRQGKILDNRGANIRRIRWAEQQTGNRQANITPRISSSSRTFGDIT